MLQHDNDSVHKVWSMKKKFAMISEEELKWPEQSPNPDQTEHLCD